MNFDFFPSILLASIYSTGRCIGNIAPPSRSFIVTASDGSGVNVTIPPICFNDGPAGVRLGGNNVTGFPPAINVASTFSRSLMYARGVALGEEFRGKGMRTLQNRAFVISDFSRHQCPSGACCGYCMYLINVSLFL